MRACDSVRAIPGVGLEGDRYATGRGYWCFERRYVSEVTFVASETIARVASALGAPFGGDESRRNVLTEGIDLRGLIGVRFRVGPVTFEGERSCDPCAYLDRLLEKPVRGLLGEDGGLRARVVDAGTIRIGDAIVVDQRVGVGDGALS